MRGKSRDSARGRLLIASPVTHFTTCPIPYGGRSRPAHCGRGGRPVRNISSLEGFDHYVNQDLATIWLDK
jgi:hypothetical protein